MRVFWVLIIALLACAFIMRSQRMRAQPGVDAGTGARIVIDRPFDVVPSKPAALEPKLEAEPISMPAEETTGSVDVPEPDPEEVLVENIAEPEPDSARTPEAPIIETVGEGVFPPEPTPEADPEPVGEIVIDLAKIKPPPADHTINPDGSIRLADGTQITGSGTAEHPFMVQWATLRSVDRVYQPRSGRSEFPAWLHAIDGKIVRVEGNTLVPVVSQSTKEMLVMQNPWDGCCIGIPPTPFDAIEVSLVHDVDFGYESVGFGVVTGTFVVDPYVVDGWVLGVYLLKDASYKSDAGTVLPDL
ncbi:MAG: hypothetical protein KC996_03350 [Phycisphaerales bacterium]|nr:hypothetical protein [Phycisphaerales bacterium]